MVDQPIDYRDRNGVINMGAGGSPMTLEEFLAENPQAGALKVAVSQGRGLIPIEDARIYVTRLLGGDKVIMGKGVTDKSGILDDIILPAPSRSGSFIQESADIPYALYDIGVEHPDFESVTMRDIPIYEGIKSIQNINMMRRGE